MNKTRDGFKKFVKKEYNCDAVESSDGDKTFEDLFPDVSSCRCSKPRKMAFEPIEGGSFLCRCIAVKDKEL